MSTRLLGRLVGLLVVTALLVWSRPAAAEEQDAGRSRISIMDVHRLLGTVALGAFASALVIGSASGNLGKLMDADRCCPDGGDRVGVWRTTDRILVNTGIVTYSAAAALAAYNRFVRNPPTESNPRVGHHAHRWLALAHGAAFATSAVTGYVMSRSQSAHPDRFASAARIHVASNVLLVPLLTAAYANILFE